MTRIKPKIHLPKPHSFEMQKAIESRRLWKERAELASRKLKEINKQIELLEFQEEIELNRPAVVPTRTIGRVGGFEWGIYWKDALVSTIPLHKVKGLGKARSQRIIESFRTVGDLESWRIVHGLECIPGITKNAARNLEEVLIKWLQTFAPDYPLRASSDALPKPKEKTQGGVLCLFEE